MYTPPSSGVALALLCVNLACWGSWGNTVKLSTLPFPVYYLIFSFGCCFWATVLGLTLGSDLYATDEKHHDFAQNLRTVGMGPAVLCACASGALSSIATVLLTLLVTLVGLATAFPVCVGTGLVVGTLLAYVVEPGTTDLYLLCAGVGLAVLALVAMMGAHYLKGRAEEDEEEGADGYETFERNTSPAVLEGDASLAGSGGSKACGGLSVERGAASGLLGSRSFGTLSLMSSHSSGLNSREVGLLLEPELAAPALSAASVRAEAATPEADAAKEATVLRSYTFPLAPWVPLPQLPKPRTPAVRATLGLSVLSGLTMGGFPPLETLSQDQKRLVAVFAGRGDDGALIPYATSFYFCAASLLCAWPACVALARRPVYGAWPRVPSIVGLLRRGGLRSLALPWLGAALWTLGTTLNFVAGRAFSSQAVAYAIGQSAPLVAALWGVFYWKEWHGAPRASGLLLGLMFLCYFGAVVTLALSSGKM